MSIVVGGHTRIRPFNTSDTYPEQHLDNDLCQAVVAGNTVYLRGQIGQDLTRLGVADELERLAPDVVDFHYRWAPNYHRAFVRAGRFSRLAFTYNNSFGEGTGVLRWASLANDAWTRRFIRRADRIVCVSRFVRADLETRGFPSDRLCVVPNGVDVASVSAEAAKGTVPKSLRGHRFVAGVHRIVDMPGRTVQLLYGFLAQNGGRLSQRAGGVGGVAHHAEPLGGGRLLGRDDVPDPVDEVARTVRGEHEGVTIHAANSAATLRDPASHFDMARCGIAIYGLACVTCVLSLANRARRWLPASLAVIAAIWAGTIAPRVLGQVPFQPLFDLSEDRLIAHTFERYLATGDAEWPLLLPMVNSVVRAFDASSQASEREWGSPLERFTVTGGSKRGWTTWLTAAVDRRVVTQHREIFAALQRRDHPQRRGGLCCHWRRAAPQRASERCWLYGCKPYLFRHPCRRGHPCPPPAGCRELTYKRHRAVTCAR